MFAYSMQKYSETAGAADFFLSILALKKQQFLFEPRKYHPDKNLEASKDEASRRFREVAEAYAALNQFLG